jgi:hypothetical protein
LFNPLIQAEVKQETIIELNIAIQNANIPFFTSTYEYINDAIDDYSWTIGNTTYIFKTTETKLNDISTEGLLDNYDVFINAGGQTEHAICAFPIIPGSSAIKENIRDFIDHGGGYIGHCGGSSLALVFDHPHKTLWELIKRRNTFLSEDPGVKCHASIAGEPFLSEYVYFGEYGIPHPMYFASLVTYFAFVILSLSVIALVMFFLVTIFYYYLCRYEEHILIEKLGSEYQQYMKKVPMLFPRIILKNHP